MNEQNKTNKQNTVSKRKSNSKRSNKSSKRRNLVQLKKEQLIKLFCLTGAYIAVCFRDEIKRSFDFAKNMFKVIIALIKLILIWR